MKWDNFTWSYLSRPDQKYLNQIGTSMYFPFTKIPIIKHFHLLFPGKTFQNSIINGKDQRKVFRQLIFLEKDWQCFAHSAVYRTFPCWCLATQVLTCMHGCLARCNPLHLHMEYEHPNSLCPENFFLNFCQNVVGHKLRRKKKCWESCQFVLKDVP